MRKALIIISLVFFVQISSADFAEADADVFYPPETPSNLYLSEIIPIEMKKEKVILDIKQERTSSEEAKKYGDKAFYADVTATFTMANNSDQDQEIDTSFPLVASFYKDDYSTRHPEEIRYIRNFRVFVNEKELNTAKKEQKLKIDEKDKEQIGNYLVETYPVMVWKQNFPANEEIEIVVKYKAFAGLVWSSEYSLPYILSTGASWDKNIGSGEIIYNFPIEVDKDLIVGNYSQGKYNYKLDGKTVVFSFENLEPKIGDNINLFFYDIDDIKNLRKKEKELTVKKDSMSLLNLMDEYSIFVSIFFKQENEYYLNKKYEVALRLLDIARDDKDAKIVDEVLSRFFYCYRNGEYDLTSGVYVHTDWKYFKDILVDLEALKNGEKDEYGYVMSLYRSCLSDFLSRDNVDNAKYQFNLYAEGILKKSIEVLSDIDPKKQRTIDAGTVLDNFPEIRKLIEEENDEIIARESNNENNFSVDLKSLLTAKRILISIFGFIFLVMLIYVLIKAIKNRTSAH